jgi:hypothetical protein
MLKAFADAPTKHAPQAIPKSQLENSTAQRCRGLLRADERAIKHQPIKNRQKISSENFDGFWTGT